MKYALQPICIFSEKPHCVKSVRSRSFFGPYFPTFLLNTERCSVSFCIQSKYGKIRTRKTPNTDTFHTVLMMILGSPIWILVIISSIRFLLKYSRLLVALNSLFYLVFIHLFLTFLHLWFLWNPFFSPIFWIASKKYLGANCLRAIWTNILYHIYVFYFSAYCFSTVLIFKNID